MTISIPLNYQKRKNTSLFHNFQNHPGIQLSDVQNYIPIYQQFFSLNANNYNSINLNHLWSIHEIKNPVNIKHGNGHDNDDDNTDDGRDAISYVAIKKLLIWQLLDEKLLM